MLLTGIESVAYFGETDYEFGMAKMKSHGYDCIDYQGFSSPSSPFYELDESEISKRLKSLKAAADNTGLIFWQAHGLWPHDDTTKESREQVLSKQQRSIKWAAALGCKYLVIHPAMPYGWGVEPCVKEAHDKTIERLVGLLPVAKSEGVTVCLENMPFLNGHSFSTVQEVKDIITEINDSNIKACLDTGHCNVVRESVYNGIKCFGEDLAAMHVHDSACGQDRHLIPYQGEIDWEGFIKGLTEIRFDGCISLETRIHPKTPEPMKERLQIELANIVRFFAKSVESDNKIL